MSVTVKSIGLKGMSGYIVKVEVKVMNGINSFTIVGLPDLSVRESKQRVMATLMSLDQKQIYEKKIFVNLSPTEQKKNGPFFDLAMAIGIIHEMGLYSFSLPEKTAFLGALSLDGSIQTVEGILPSLLAARSLGFEKIICPYHPSISYLDLFETELIIVSSIEETIHYLINGVNPNNHLPKPINETFDESGPEQDFSFIIGQNRAKRALEVSAAGGHNLLMFGPPGCGKSLLAESFPSILPPLTSEQRLEVSSLYQLSSVPRALAISQPPFRQPHHSSSAVSLIGGGSYPKPGEISLAHYGVLFLDELPEFPKKALEMLRQPIESGYISISRVHSSVTYPARFILIAAMNPCPCGYRYSNRKFCICSPKQLASYRRKISGPILDRMDMVIKIKSEGTVDYERKKPETSEAIKKRVILARNIQFERYQNNNLNSFISIEKLLESVCLSERQKQYIKNISKEHQFSTRVQMKILRVARTISDLSGEEAITQESIEEAISLRQEEF